MEIPDFPMDEFKCPISKKVYEDRNFHRKLCIYKYCKKNWVWSNIKYD